MTLYPHPHPGLSAHAGSDAGHHLGHRPGPPPPHLQGPSKDGRRCLPLVWVSRSGRDHQEGDSPGRHPQGSDPSLPTSAHQADPALHPWIPSRVLNSLHHSGMGPLLDPVLSPTVGYDRTNKQHHSLLLCLLMTSCDLSDQTKGWKTTRKIAVSATPSWEGAGCTHCLALCGS